MTQVNPTPFDIKKYITLIVRKRYIAISTCLIVISLFTWGSFFLPKTYEASSIISIEGESMIKPLIQGIGVSGSVEDKTKNIKNEITSRSIIEKVIKRLGMDSHIRDPLQYDTMIDNIRNNMDVNVEGDRKQPALLKISYKGDDPNKVAEVVNTVVNAYIEEHLKFRRTDASEAYDFILSQVQEYKKKLEDSDRAIREFKERNPNLIPQSETTLLSRLESFQSSKIETDIRMKELIRKRDNLRKQLSGEKELTVAFVTKEGSPQARLNYLNNQLMLLMTKYTDNYPEVIRVKSEIEELKKQIAQAKDSALEGGSETSTLNPIYQQLKEELTKTEAEIETLKARSSELSRQQQETQRILGRMPKEQEEWTRLQRDRNVYQQIYDQLLQKLENARVSKEIELTDKGEAFRIVDPATVPLFPVKPDRLRMILMGIFFGIASGIGVVFLLDYFDHSFKDEDSIQEALKLPVLATIPKIVTEEDEISIKRLDKKVFIASGAYILIIFLVLIKEFLSRYMGINIINF
jgi:polysaccharide chain length determinant protein (PEP-CTERM system associated)